MPLSWAMVSMPLSWAMVSMPLSWAMVFMPVSLVMVVHSPLVAHGVHAPVVSHAVHAPVVAHHAVQHAAPAYDTPSPYTYSYAVSDDYSKANFNAAESSDGAGNADGSYSVALPDGRIQHVNYHVNGYDGYVADVTYDGAPQYPEYHPAAPAYP